MNWKRMRHFLIVTLGLALGVSLYAYMNIEAKSNQVEYLLSAILGLVVCYLIAYTSTLLDKVISWRNRTGYRLLSGLVLHFVLASSLIILALRIYGASQQNLLVKLGVLLLALSLLYNIVYFIFYSYHTYAKGQVESRKLERMQKELQLSALKSQLSPHFLFNSLNALSTLFHKDLALARTFIKSLAHSFRYVLKNYENKLVSVKDEMNFVEDYVQMMHVRFGSLIYIDTSLGEDASKMLVPPLTIQMLVENAVKHNHMDDENPLTIKIVEKEKHIEVQNQKNLRPRLHKSTNVGLKNIAKRYELICGKSIKIEESDSFTVQLPIIR